MKQLPPQIGSFLDKFKAMKMGFGKIDFSKIDVSKESLQRLLARKPAADGKTKPVFQLPKALALDIRFGEAGKYFSGAVFEKALVTIDKSALLIMGVAWLVAVVAVAGAFIAVRDAAQLKIKAETARALEPVLPKIERIPLSKEQYDPLAARLHKQFPAILIEVTGKPTLKLHSQNVDDFMTWINAVSYVDGMVSTIRWTISSFCVGSECADNAVMQAELTAEAINITQPDTSAQ